MHLAWGSGADSSALLVTGPGVVELLGRHGPEALGDLARRVAVVPTSALAVAIAVVPMAGRWSTGDDALRFAPRLPFRAGTRYSLVRQDDTEALGTVRWAEVARLARPAADVPPTASVVAIHPDVAEVPENLLRLSVTFSSSMDEGSAADHVRLEDADGNEIPHALLAMPPELWDRPRRRLTLLLEPGRIKRGLVPHTALGAPLAEGDEATLVVDTGMRDATGTALVRAARRRYRVGPAVRTRVDPEQWRVSWPPAGSYESLVVDFDRPLDHALVRRCLRVAAAENGTVPGRAALHRGATRWSFTPTGSWPATACELHVDAALEDLAGNSVRRVFDRDLRREQDDPLDVAVVVLNPDGAVRR